MAEQISNGKEDLRTLSASEAQQVGGAASIYIDGNYWGEGDLDLRPWPGGFPVVQRAGMRFI